MLFQEVLLGPLFQEVFVGLFVHMIMSPLALTHTARIRAPQGAGTGESMRKDERVEIPSSSRRGELQSRGSQRLRSARTSTSRHEEEEDELGLRKVLSSNTWLLAIDGLIITNTVCLCLVGSLPGTRAGEQLRATLRPIIDVCSGLFILEIIFRAYVAGALWKFLRSPSNLFDAVVTIVSSLGILVLNFGVTENSVEALRSLAVIRVLRIMMVFRGTRRLMASIAEALPHILDLVFFMLIIFWIFAVLGRDAFAARLALFQDFRESLMTLATVFVADSWTEYMWMGVNADCLVGTSAEAAAADLPLCANVVSEPMGAGFFILFHFVCQMILVALFVAVILDKVSGVTNGGDQDQGQPTHMEAFIDFMISTAKGSILRVAASVGLYRISHTHLFVSVLEAESLKTSQVDEMLCDSFVRVRLGRRRQETYVYPDSFTPYWDMQEPFHFSMRDVVVAPADDSLHFQVLNDHCTKMFEHLGEATLRVSSIKSDLRLVTTEAETAAGTTVWEIEHWVRLKEYHPDGSGEDVVEHHDFHEINEVLQDSQSAGDITRTAKDWSKDDAVNGATARRARPGHSVLQSRGKIRVRIRLESRSPQGLMQRALQHLAGQASPHSVRASAQSFGTKRGADHDDGDAQNVENDVKSPLQQMALQTKRKGLVARARDSCSFILTAAWYRPTLYAVVVVDSCLLVSNVSALLPVAAVLDLIFWVEFVLKTVSFGFGFRTSSTVIQVGEENSLVTRVVDPYFTQYWNRLDFLCLLSSGKTVLTILDLEKMTPRLALEVLGLLRCLRPLRLVTRSDEMRELVGSLVRAGSSVVRVIFFYFCIFLIFAVIGQGLFRDKFDSCTDPSIVRWPRTSLEPPTHKALCVGSFQWQDNSFFLRYSGCRV